MNLFLHTVEVWALDLLGVCSMLVVGSAVVYLLEGLRRRRRLWSMLLAGALAILALQPQGAWLLATFCAVVVVVQSVCYAQFTVRTLASPHTTKATGGSSTGLYGFLRELWGMRALLRAHGRRLVLGGEPEASCNLMPVDWLVEDMLQICREGLRDGGIYHPTCRDGLSVRTVARVVAAELGMPGLDVVTAPVSGASSASSPSSASSLSSSLERRFHKRTAFYRSYLSHGKIFERARPFDRCVTAEDLAAYVRGYLQGTLRTATLWGTGGGTAVAQLTVES